MESQAGTVKNIDERLKILEVKVQEIINSLETPDTEEKTSEPWEVTEIGKVMTKWYKFAGEGVMVSASRDKDWGWINTSPIKTLTELPIEKAMFLLSPFANEQRLKILLELSEYSKSATDLSNATKLHGGQLYHHLETLMDAKYVEKVYKGKYRLTSIGRWAFLNVLHTAHHLSRFEQNK